MWTAVKIAAVASGVLVTVLFLALLVMVTRPALLVGVSGSTLSHSVRGDEGAPDCVKREDGSWDCYWYGSPPPHHRVKVDWTGCWKATRLSPYVTSDDPKHREGCIELGDVITFD